MSTGAKRFVPDIYNLYEALLVFRNGGLPHATDVSLETSKTNCESYITRSSHFKNSVHRLVRDELISEQWVLPQSDCLYLFNYQKLDELERQIEECERSALLCAQETCGGGPFVHVGYRVLVCPHCMMHDRRGFVLRDTQGVQHLVDPLTGFCMPLRPLSLLCPTSL